MPPFEKNSHLSSRSVEALSEWLEEHADKATVIAEGYTVGDLIADLDNMADGIWSDGIDAMGEDA